EMLPSGPCWKLQVIITTHPIKSPVVLCWHDPLKCISNIFNHLLSHNCMNYTYCVYTEWMTGDCAWEI
ncbi:hypothetical protein EDD22DRAFT_780996, partial [Suillus occidentalis]